MPRGEHGTLVDPDQERADHGGDEPDASAVRAVQLDGERLGSSGPCRRGERASLGK